MLAEVTHFPVNQIAVKMAVSVGIGMLMGMERIWSHKELGIRTFSIISLLGMICSLISTEMTIGGLVGVLLLVIITNAKSILIEKQTEITTSAALIVAYLLGTLVGLGHIFTPVAGAIIVTMLLAWKDELNKFAGGLKPAEIRSGILLGLIGFVIYPILPNRYIDPWQLFNPSDAWLSVIALAGIGFINYILLRIFSTKGLYLGAIFGGTVNSTATVAEICSRMQYANTPQRITSLCLLTTIAMFARNLVLAFLFSPESLSASLVPLLMMSVVAGLWIGRDYYFNYQKTEEKAIEIDSPIAIKKVLRFAGLFVSIQIIGTLLTRFFGSYGILATGFFGGLVSSASTTLAATTMAMHGTISASLAGSATVLSSLASVIVNLPIVWRIVKDKKIVRKVTLQTLLIVAVGVATVVLDRVFHISDYINLH